MTNKEAIIELRDLEDYCNSTFLKRTCKAYTQAINKGIEAIENQKSIIEELENIKQEIQSIIALADSRGEDTKLPYQCQTVITERISELKGE